MLLLSLVSSIPTATQGCPYLQQTARRRLQGGMGPGQGGGGGGGMGMGPGNGGGGGGMGMGNPNSPGQLIQQLFDNHLLMDREVVYNDDGTILTRTTSEDSTVASFLQDHVAQMQGRVEEEWQVRAWDPFFVELFERHDELDVQVTNLDNGVEVFLSADTDCGQAIIEDHTAVVTLFVETGREEGRKAHDVPNACLADSEESVEQEPNETNEVDTEIAGDSGTETPAATISEPEDSTSPSSSPSVSEDKPEGSISDAAQIDDGLMTSNFTGTNNNITMTDNSTLNDNNRTLLDDDVYEDDILLTGATDISYQTADDGSMATPSFVVSSTLVVATVTTLLSLLCR